MGPPPLPLILLPASLAAEAGWLMDGYVCGARDLPTLLQLQPTWSRESGMLRADPGAGLSEPHSAHVWEDWRQGSDTWGAGPPGGPWRTPPVMLWAPSQPLVQALCRVSSPARCSRGKPPGAGDGKLTWRPAQDPWIFRGTTSQGLVSESDSRPPPQQEDSGSPGRKPGTCFYEVS